MQPLLYKLQDKNLYMADPIKYIAIDDEAAGINSLTWEIEGTGIACEQIATFTDPETALKSIPQLQFDICFLDIEMPIISGFDLLMSLKTIHFDVIFTTAYDHYAIKAFKLEALDYLLKPINGSELKQALLKHQKLKENQLIIDRIESLFNNFKSSQQFKKISIPSQDGLDFVAFPDVIRLEAESNYTFIFTQNKKYVVSKTLKDYEDQLPSDQFIRIHRSHIINIQYISRYQKGKINSIVLDDGTTIPISNERKDNIKDVLDI